MNELAPGCSSRSSAIISSCSEMVCCYLAGLHPCGLPLWSSSPPAWQQVMYKPCQPRLCLQTPACAVPFISSSLTKASHALQLRLSSVLRLGPKHQSGSRCHLVNLPSQILHQHLSTLPAPSPPLLCTVPADTRNLSLPTFTTSSFTFPPASCSFTHFHWSFCTDTVAQCSSVSVGITGHTDFICYSHPHFCAS